MKKTLFDADIGCNDGPACPKFVFDNELDQVELVDKQGNKATMSRTDFNKFVNAVLSGELKQV